MLVAARDAGVQSFTYAASSSTYGDHSALPKVEGVIGKPLSPYAVTKYVNGDSETSRDFCFIENAVQANLLAATAPEAARGEVYNVVFGDRTTLNILFESLARALTILGRPYEKQPVYREFRAGDVRHSQASIEKAKDNLGYAPEFPIQEGITKAMPWYRANVD